MSMNGHWRELYEAAMLELNPAELGKKIGLAKTEIRRRGEEITSIPDADWIEEQRAMSDALRALDLLGRLELKLHSSPASQMGRPSPASGGGL